jgi:D-hexose-6-phosphate mutarotase
MTTLAPGVRLESGRGGLPVLRVDGPAARAEIYLHGATVTDWTPRGGEPVLWVSSASRFTHDAPIRGGVPICFPWFGSRDGHPESASHGFARLCEWSLLSAHADTAGDDVTVRLRLTDRDVAAAYAWPHRFEAIYTVVVGSRLSLALTVTNRGDEPVVFQEALHTYLGVRDVRAVEVTGLEGTVFHDQLAVTAAVGGEPGPVRFAGETDRIYLDAGESTTVLDGRTGRSVRIAKSGSATTVVWNPWVAKAAALPDFGDDEWKQMVCVEVCNVGAAAIGLEPGESHTMTATFEASPSTTAPTQRSTTS